MTYSVKEIFYTLQGEGARTGRPSVFLRFAGCNLWTGLAKDRAQAVANSATRNLSAPIARAVEKIRKRSKPGARRY